MLEGGMKDVASAPFRDRYGLWGWLDLWRSSGDQFSSRELRWLDRVASVVTTALRAGLAATFMKPAARTPSGPLVLMLTPELQVTDTTPKTHEYLEQLVPPAPGRDAIPANAYNVAAQLIAVERDVDDHPPRARTHLAEGLWVSVGAARLGPPEQGERPIVVTIEACTGADRADVFARVHGLSERESELLSILASGPDTRDAARGMSISEHTVQDHLKSIFAKTSTRTRSALLARATAS
jgi:DNA-binding CsgD family transcriptional regulator